jgi:ribosomal protein S18 acetylase RimI-like enzyme
MKCELLAESNLSLLLDFIDDVNTKYDETVLKAFLDEKNSYGYIAVDDEKAIGFAYGYVLNEPDGRKTFYLHAIDIMAAYQNLGYGTELVRFVHAHSAYIQ